MSYDYNCLCLMTYCDFFKYTDNSCASFFFFNLTLLLLFFWLHVGPGIKPVPPALGAWNLNCWTTWEVSLGFIFLSAACYPTVKVYNLSSLLLISLWNGLN